jgi:hypothetical protein
MLLAWIAPGDVVDGEAEAGHAGGVDEDLNLALAAADEVDAADAGDLLHALLDLVLGDLGEVADRQVAGEGDREDGGGAGVELGDDGRVDAAGQVALDRGDLVADVLEGLVAVDLEFELEDRRW